MCDILPNEVMLEIFSYLDMNDLALSVQHVNSRWKELSRDKQLWKDRVFEPDNRMLDEERVHLLRNMPSLKAYVSYRGRNTELIIDTLCTYCEDIERLHLNASHAFKYPLLVKFTNSFCNIGKLIIPYLKEDNPLQFSELIGNLNNLNTLGFTDRYAEVPDGILKPIADGCPSLQHMDLGDNKFREEDVRYFLKKKQTQLLTFRFECYVSVATFNCIIQCKSLENLRFSNFNNSNVSPRDIKQLKNLKNLKSLIFCYLKEAQCRAIPSLFERGSLCNVTKLQFEAYDLRSVVKNCPQLLELTVGGRKRVLEEGFEHIGNCKNLRYLSLSGCSGVTPKCLEYVAVGCPNLRYLDLSCSLDIDDSLIPSALKCKNLRVINISYSAFRGTDFHLFPTHLVHLRELVIHECGVDDEVWDRLLEKMPHLKLTGRYYYGDD